MGFFLYLLLIVIAYRAYKVWRSGEYLHSDQPNQEADAVNPATGLPMQGYNTDIAGNRWGTQNKSHTNDFESNMFSDD